jgi:hypothetical protein
MNGTWSRVDVGGKPAEVYDLAGGARPRFGVLYLGGPSLDGRTAFTRLFDDLRLVCVGLPEHRFWWADRPCPAFDPVLTPERYLLQNVLPFFQERWQLAARAVGLLGILAGGQGALRLGFKRPGTFPVVAAIASAIDYHEWYGRGTALDDLYDSKEQCRQDTAPMHVHPSHYPPHLFFCMAPDDELLYRGNDRLHEKLNALGVPHEVDLTTRSNGRSWDYFDQQAERALRFVNAGLEQEGRRLL